MIRKRFRRRKFKVIDVIGDSPAVYDYLTVPDFQANAATGTATNPENANDNDWNTDVIATLNQYIEIDFGKVFAFKQFKHCGDSSNNGDGEWKIQYWDGVGWIDWVTGISTFEFEQTWTSWQSGDAVTAQKIRIVASVQDSVGSNSSGEWEVKY